MRAVRPNSVTISDDGLAPGVAHATFDRGNGVVERTEQRGQKSAGHAFIDVRVPSIKRKRAGARAIGLDSECNRESQEFQAAATL